MKKKFTVKGMTCSACSARVESSAKKVKGVKSASVNLLQGTLIVETENEADSDLIKQAVVKEGYGIEDYKYGAEIKTEKEEKQVRTRLFVSVPLSIILMYVSMGHMLHLPLPAVFAESALVFAITQMILCLPILIVNKIYFSRGFKKLFRLAPNMDSLIAMGSFVSFAYGIFAVIMIASGHAEEYGHNLYFESAGMILTLITLGKYLEAKSKKRTTEAVTKLIGLAPEKAVKFEDGIEKEILTEEIKKGDILIVKAGMTVPADGIITEGSGYADESMITGESMPVSKNTGSSVTGATVLTGGYIKMRAEKVGEDSVLAEIIKLVEDANSTKAPIARLADKVAGIFVPAVITIAVLGLVIWLISGATVAFAVNIAVSVLVISCPCALGLATPVAITVSTGFAAERGILIKSGEALENLNKCTVAVFDKTGTLTEGKPEVYGIYGKDENKIISVAYALELKSEHMLAKPIIGYAEKHNIVKLETEEYKTISGRGISGKISGIEYFIGNSAFISENLKEKFVDGGEAEKLAEKGCTVLYAADENEFLGYIAVKDRIKTSAVNAVNKLKKRNIKVMMLTGDNEVTAAAAAVELGGIDYKAEVLPKDKDDVIKELQSKGEKVIMVGDGINDAPALTRADVGIAIGAGTQVAVSGADVVLIKNDPEDVAAAVKISSKTVLNIKENLFWAFFYNIICIPIALGALYPAWGITLNPMIGSACMSVSSICVVLNALRLKNIKIEKGEKNMFGKKENEVKIEVEGMMCDHCRMRVENALNSIEGVKAKVDLKKKSAVLFNAENVSDEEIKQKIEEAGYKTGKIVR